MLRTFLEGLQSKNVGICLKLYFNEKSDILQYGSVVETRAKEEPSITVYTNTVTQKPIPPTFIFLFTFSSVHKQA